MKEWTIVGIPTVLAAVSALASVEGDVKEEDKRVPEKRFVLDIIPAMMICY